MTAVLTLTVLGASMGFVIALAVKAFAVQVDPRIEEIEGLLPGANCGACGYAGCAEFARRLAAGEAQPTQCPANSHDAVSGICALLGITAGKREAKVAVVRCGSGDNTSGHPNYNGVLDCTAAQLVAGGPKFCDYGCLGLGTCARACPFGAIEITRDSLAVIHPDICTGCGKCVSVCPRNLIELVPKHAPIHVFCNSPEKGAVKKKLCEVSCIGCRRCVKEAGADQMEMQGFLAHINYLDPPPASVAAVCPTGCLRASPRGADSAKRDSESADPATASAEPAEVPHG